MQDAARVRDATGRASSGWSWGAVEGTQTDRDASDSPRPQGAPRLKGEALSFSFWRSQPDEREKGLQRIFLV